MTMVNRRFYTTDDGTDTGTPADLLATLPPSTRRVVARLIRTNQATLVQGWIDRHREQPKYATEVQRVTNDWATYRRRYAEPLNYVLARAFATARPELLHLYQSERKLFLPTDVMQSGGTAELQTILEHDALHLKQILGDAIRVADTTQLAERIIDTIHASPGQGPDTRIIKIAFVGDCLMDEIRSFVYPIMENSGHTLETRHFYFSAPLGVELGTVELEAAIDSVKFDLIALSFLTFQGLPVYTSLLNEASSRRLNRRELAGKADAVLGIIDNYISSVRAKTNTPILLHGCSIVPRRRWRRVLPILPAATPCQAAVLDILNKGLQEIAEGVENVIFIDEAARLAENGYRRSTRPVLPRSVTDGSLFHPSRFGIIMAQDYARIITTYELLRDTKVLLVDFDNTLWNGVMADGEVVHDHQAQALLKQLKEAGILLVSVSKNDRKNIRWEELALSEDDFVLHKISWENKPQLVIEAAQQLDLDPKSFVLIDDNPVERDLVTTQVPGVKALDPGEPQTWKRLQLLLCFPATRSTDEAARRTEIYREAAKRRNATGSAIDYAEMMRSLDLRAVWRRGMPADLDRIDELVNRTNQFNTTSIRYSKPDLIRLLESTEHDIFVATLSDKFGALGIVGVVITHIQGDDLHYENIVMSCRAMGFGLESVLVRKPLDMYSGLSTATGRYISTERNNPCARLFLDHGFDGPDGERWEFQLTRQLPTIPDWLSVECR